MIYVLRLHDFMWCHAKCDTCFNEMWQNAPSTCFSIRLTYQSAAEQKREERRKQALAPQINCKTLISAIRSPDSLFVTVVYLGYWYYRAPIGCTPSNYGTWNSVTPVGIFCGPYKQIQMFCWQDWHQKCILCTITPPPATTPTPWVRHTFPL